MEKRTHVIYTSVILVLFVIILLLKFTKPESTDKPVYIPGKPFALPPETTIVEKPIFLTPPIPPPVSSEVIQKDTCLDLTLNTYEVLVDDSVLSGKTIVGVEGKLKSVVLDYKAKQKEILKPVLRVDTLKLPAPPAKKRNALYLGVDLGVIQPGIGPMAAFVHKKGFTVTSRYDFINRQATIGTALKIGK